MSLEKKLSGIRGTFAALGLGLLSLLAIGGCNDKPKPGNPDPTALNRSATLDEDTSTSVTLQGTGTGPFGYNLVTPPANGTVTLSGNTATYTPDPDFNGPDPFQYDVTNAGGITSPPATVTMNVTPMPDDPTAISTGTKDVREDELMDFTLTPSDADGDTVTTTLSNPPTGSNFDSATGQFTWRPNFTDGDDPSGTKTYSLDFLLDDGTTTVTHTEIVTIADVPNPEPIYSGYNDGSNKAVFQLSNGTGLTQISPIFIGRVCKTPGKTRITYFRSDNPGTDGHDLRIADPDGTNEKKLTNNPGWDEIQAKISPDETLIAYSSGEQGFQKIYVADYDKVTEILSNPQPLNSNTNVEYWPIFSADSQWLYYSANKGDWEVCRFRADRSGLEQNLTNNAADDLASDISPDGSILAFTSNRNAGIHQIFLADPTGASPSQLTSNPLDAGSANFSPDGKELVYSINAWDLYIIKVDGNDNRIISEGSFSYFDPDW